LARLASLCVATLLVARVAAAEPSPTPASSPAVAATLPSVPAAPASLPTVPPERAAKIAGERAAVQAKCWADLEALCPGIETRQDRIRCIRQNRQKLPQSCRQSRQMRGAPIRAACAADAEKLCKDVPRGRKRLQCLVEHRPEVSAACGQALDQRRGGPGPVRGPLGGAGG
jgi:hypothetical protein